MANERFDRKSVRPESNGTAQTAAIMNLGHRRTSPTAINANIPRIARPDNGLYDVQLL